MDTKNIIIDVPLLEGNTDTPNIEKRKVLPIISKCIILVLMAISLLLHTAIIANAVEYFKEHGSDILISQFFPKYKISEPMIPTLPEGNEIKENADDTEENDTFPVRVCDLSTNAEYGLALINETSYNPDLLELLGTSLSESSERSNPKVLIYHSHATEGYSDTAGTSFRTHDSERNMIAIGKIIKEVLEKAGIETIHLTQLFDSKDWSASYDNSNAQVLEELSKDPDIQYVFDIHRDCIGNDEEGYVKTATNIYKKDTAQLMFVCGTDEGGSGHTQWRDNLAFAARLQSETYNSFPSLMRPINLRRASFYQNTTPNSLILECGTCANTLDEAKRGAVIFASTLANYILEKEDAVSPKTMIETLCP